MKIHVIDWKIFLMCITNKILITTYKEHLEIIRKAQITRQMVKCTSKHLEAKETHCQYTKKERFSFISYLENTNYNIRNHFRPF